MLALLLVLQSSEACMPFTCATSLPNFACITIGSTISVSACSDPLLKFCPFNDFSTNSTCVSMPPSPESTAYPNDPCTSNLTCVYSDCQFGVCQGILSSSSCNDTGQCQPGYRCDSQSQTCKVQLFNGYNSGTGLNTNCTTDFDCVNNGMCDQGNCFEYFSRTEGEYVDNCTNGLNWLCKSGMCYDNVCLSELVQADGVLPVACKSDADCVSSYYSKPPEKIVVNTECQCGFNSNGTSYCTLFPNDKPMVRFLSVLNEWLSSQELFNCHSYSRFSLSCIKTYWSKKNYAKYAYYYYMVTMWPQIQGNLPCITQVITSQYYSSQSYYKNSWASALAAGLWIIFIS